MRRKFFVLVIFCLSGFVVSFAQELNCQVSVNSSQVSSQERAIFEEMEVEFAKFLNEKRWTDKVFQISERINCNLVVNLQKSSDPVLGNYSATVQVQSSRPVFNSNYETLLLKFADRHWDYSYLTSQPLVFNENSFSSNLTSMMAYYAYIIIGYDFDSFSKMGGSEYFEKARDIVTNAQESNQSGWKFDVERNRYQLSSDLNNVQFSSLRAGIYDYHRQALDNMILKQPESRAIILTFLRNMQKTHRTFPNSIFINSFLDAKSDELTALFSDGDLKERREAYNILADLDPAKISTYRSILQN